jgi:hypothetical protein
MIITPLATTYQKVWQRQHCCRRSCRSLSCTLSCLCWVPSLSDHAFSIADLCLPSTNVFFYVNVNDLRAQPFPLSLCLPWIHSLIGCKLSGSVVKGMYMWADTKYSIKVNRSRPHFCQNIWKLALPQSQVGDYILRVH